MTELQEIDHPRLRDRFRLPPAMRYPAFRKYWLGSLASVSGFQMMYVAEGWLAYELTGSALYLGYVGIAAGIPAIFLNLFGGVVADRLDKRYLILMGQIVMATVIGLLGLLTITDLVLPWHLVVAAFITGSFGAFEMPARQALYPHLIEREALTSAVALNSSIWQGTRIGSPAVAGLLISTLGTSAAFFTATAGFLIMCFVILTLSVPRIESHSTGSAFNDMLVGVRFIKRESIFSFLISMTFFNSFFGMSYVALMPIFAKDILGVGADGQGMLLSVSGVGALLTTVWLGSRGSPPWKGLLLIGGAVMFGTSVAAFALTAKYLGSYPLAIGIIFLMGVFNSIYMISIQSTLQMLVPDHMRGRVMGFYGMTWSIFPLGGMQASAVANVIGAPFAIFAGGVAVAAFALGPALLNRRVRNLGLTLMQAERAAAGHQEGQLASERTSS